METIEEIDAVGRRFADEIEARFSRRVGFVLVLWPDAGKQMTVFTGGGRKNVERALSAVLLEMRGASDAPGRYGVS